MLRVENKFIARRDLTINEILMSEKVLLVYKTHGSGPMIETNICKLMRMKLTSDEEPRKARLKHIIDL